VRRPPLPPIEELRERVLHERQGSGLFGDVRGHLGDERRLHVLADRARRPDDRPLELIGRERGHDLGVASEKLAEPRVDERAVVEVGTERGDDSDPARRIDGGHAQALEQQGASPRPR
jgi:hypothetical protein